MFYSNTLNMSLSYDLCLQDECVHKDTSVCSHYSEKVKILAFTNILVSNTSFFFTQSCLK